MLVRDKVPAVEHLIMYFFIEKRGGTVMVLVLVCLYGFRSRWGFFV